MIRRLIKAVLLIGVIAVAAVFANVAFGDLSVPVKTVTETVTIDVR